MNILLTGATGFVGRRLAERLATDHRFKLTSAVRKRDSGHLGQQVLIGNASGNTDWSEILANQQVVIHAAARAHVMEETVADPLAEYRRVNAAGTLQLARQAAEAGVRRFIFISSVKVNGERTEPAKPFTEEDTPNPEDGYGISKKEAEDGLRRLAERSDMEVVIIRPPLVYGPGVKGNFATLFSLVQRGWPLPLGCIRNQRSFVAVDNLIDLTVLCMNHPSAANEVFLVSDGEDLSTTDLLRKVAEALGVPSRLYPAPVWLLKAMAILLGRRTMADRLLGSLQVNIEKSRDYLGWEPPLTASDAMKQYFARETKA